MDVGDEVDENDIMDEDEDNDDDEDDDEDDEEEEEDVPQRKSNVKKRKNIASDEEEDDDDDDETLSPKELKAKARREQQEAEERAAAKKAKAQQLQKLPAAKKTKSAPVAASPVKKSKSSKSSKSDTVKTVVQKKKSVQVLVQSDDDVEAEEEAVTTKKGKKSAAAASGSDEQDFATQQRNSARVFTNACPKSTLAICDSLLYSQAVCFQGMSPFNSLDGEEFAFHLKRCCLREQTPYGAIMNWETMISQPSVILYLANALLVEMVQSDTQLLPNSASDTFSSIWKCLNIVLAHDVILGGWHVLAWPSLALSDHRGQGSMTKFNFQVAVVEMVALPLITNKHKCFCFDVKDYKILHAKATTMKKIMAKKVMSYSDKF